MLDIFIEKKSVCKGTPVSFKGQLHFILFLESVLGSVKNGNKHTLIIVTNSRNQVKPEIDLFWLYLKQQLASTLENERHPRLIYRLTFFGSGVSLPSSFSASLLYLIASPQTFCLYESQMHVFLVTVPERREFNLISILYAIMP